MSQQPPLRLRALLATGAALALGASPLAAQGAARTGGPGPGAVAVADSLLLAGDEEGSFDVLAAYLASVPDDFEARWRAVRIAVALSVVSPTHGVRRGWALEADAQGRELLHGRPGDPEALAWAAAARGRRALNEEGLSDPARLANETWALTESLLSAHPDHPLGNHVRGKLCQQIAGLPRGARLFGRVFLGNDLVDQGTWQRAAEHHLRAIGGDPGMVFFYLDLGETYAAQGARDAAARVFRAGMAVPQRFPMDAEFKRLMAERLSSLGGQPEPDLRYY
jgi:hypothetical protein